MNHKDWDLQQAAIQQRVGQALEEHLEEKSMLKTGSRLWTMDEIKDIIDRVKLPTTSSSHSTVEYAQGFEDALEIVLNKMTEISRQPNCVDCKGR